MEALFAEYTQALIAEIESAVNSGEPHPHLETVYFGGGTPTLVPVDYLIDILGVIKHTFGVSKTAEITIEANPGTVDLTKLKTLKEAGFNRLSIGVQSLDDEFLASIGRAHSSQQAIEAYDNARRAGFENIGIDLIFALPGQTINHWANTLDSAIGLASQHISLYELSIEEGTKFAGMCAQGRLDLPDEDLQIEMYELAITKLTSAGYEHYEVSNFARPGFRSRHNQVYWLNRPYYGFGAGATSYVNGVRAIRLADPKKYTESICSEEGPIESSEQLTGRALLGETIIQGLRMREGIDVDRIDSDYDADIGLEFKKEIASLESRGLIEESDGRIRVTHQGLMLLNDVSAEFLESK